MTNLDFNYFCADCKQSVEYRKENCFTCYKVKKFEKDDYIAFKGDRVRELKLLVQGAITVSFVMPSGLVLRSIKHTAPYPLGAVALLGKENRYRVDIVADNECEVISVSREYIEERIMNCREFMLSFFDYSTSKLDLFVEHLAILSQRSIRAKLAFYIFICSDKNNKYKFNKTIRGLSEYICVERPSLSRVIAQFAEEGLITYQDGEGEILNINRLKEFVE